MQEGMPDKYTMWFNWIRWQCLNKEDWNDGEIPAGTMIDHDQYVFEVLKMMMIYRKYVTDISEYDFHFVEVEND
jgi:hypothetical protein